MPNDLGAYLALTLPFVVGYFVAGCSGRELELAPTEQAETHRKSRSFSIGRIVVRGRELELAPTEQAETHRKSRSFSIGRIVVRGRELELAPTEQAETHRKSRSFSIGRIVVLGVVLMLMGANLALTLTRAAWVSVAVAAACIGCYFVVSTVFTRVSWKRSLLAIALLSVVCCVVIVNTTSHQAMMGIVPRHIKERLETMITHPAGFMSERPQWWRASLELIQKYPLTGIGLGRFRYAYQHNGPEEQYYTPYHAHNIYLHIATEQGIPSLLVFLWMVAIICRQVFSMRKTNDFWQMGTFIGASGFLISALVYGLADIFYISGRCCFSIF